MDWRFFLLPLSLLLLATGIRGEGPVDRLCCRYRCEGEEGCPPWCASQNSCLIKNGTELVEDAACRVTVDSKKDFSSMESRLDCLQKNFKSGLSFDEPPFYLSAYSYSAGLGQNAFTGLDLRVQYSAFHRLRFRFKNLNTNVCPDHGHLTKDSSCNPRCVEVERSAEDPADNSLVLHTDLQFSYDCEMGFYISKDSKLWIEATKDSYLLSVCADSAEPSEGVSTTTRCGEYLFLMPGPLDGSMMLLVDRLEFETRNSIVVYILPPPGTEQLLLTLLLVGEDETKTPVHNQTALVVEGEGGFSGTTTIRLDHSPPSGRYQVAVTAVGGGGGEMELRVSYSAYLILPDSYLHLIILAITSALVLLGLLLAIYKRWQQVAEEGAVEPQLLVDAGRIEPKPVLVITSLHNTKHSQIVKDLCEYLRKWCGVGATYFPLDDEVGIHRGQRDPWKWCQESFELVKEEGGSLLFVAGPSPALSSPSSCPAPSLYPGLQDNQAFLATKDLRILAQQGRVLVVRFPYSTLKSLPSEVPAHLTSSTLLLPRQMNSFLSQLLQVKRKTLCSWAPFSLVQPEILPGDLARPGGAQILQSIRELTAEDTQMRMEQAALTQSKLMHRFLPSKHEEVKTTNGHHQLPPIIRPRAGGRQEEKEEDREAGQPLVPPTHHQQEEERGGLAGVLRLELEQEMPSLRDMAHRDRAVDPSA